MERLQGLKHPTDDSLPILAPGGVKVTLPRAVITALTAEITIFMREKPDDFFDHTDLLDFPGYRSRYKFTDLRAALDSKEEMLKELFLRGKVAYLFERYREEKELTSMLLCIASGPQEVHDLPHAVYEWKMCIRDSPGAARSFWTFHCVRSPSADCGGTFGKRKRIRAMPMGAIPVSYTHLDVYKRQV